MQIAELFERLFPTADAVRFTAYDGSAAGPPDAPVRVTLRSPRGLSHLATPRQLGVARAFVSGELTVDGDLYEALRVIDEPSLGRLSVQDWARILRMVVRRALSRAPVPEEEVRLRGWRHTKSRDAKAIAHHYDVSNRFYEWVLGPSMAYTCAVYPTEQASLEEAQFTKFDLVARKLGLRPGMRLLDVGCGYGGMVLHAARHYGVTALGVTLSRRQAEWAQKAIADDGLDDRAEVRHLDYRDVTETGFDVVSSIGLTEHIGKQRLRNYFAFLLGKLRPGGRLLNHCITRPRTTERPIVKRGFINRYIFPDGELHGVGHIISVMQNSGFEVRHDENLREHYAKTLAAWCANLDSHWQAAVAEVGERRARTWALYMAGSRLAFERHRIELHQVLGVKTDKGRSGMALRPDWEPMGVPAGEAAS